MEEQFELDVFLPSQYYGVLVSQGSWTPEHKLMMGVLIRTINDYLRGNADISNAAVRWFTSVRVDNFYSYQNVCDVFNLDSTGLWLKLQSRKRSGLRNKVLSEEHFLP